MKEITLTRGLVALVDDEDYERIACHKWFAHTANGKRFYARANTTTPTGRGRLLMHRLVLPVPPGFVCDHINGNGLDNRRENLRLATHAENARNRRVKHGGHSSQYRGVSWSRQHSKWRAEICVNSKRIHIGLFRDELEAAEAYAREALHHFGEFAGVGGGQ